ncbi:unnamed protein product [Vicia faba]|uniref:Neprosin PEP catalytic domain-containing protein n=1 Tax=Vicia faba TaxID=3906 RepID=A0AAV1AGC9_VICFA|nr:unnamed protein product [Vicia faba]
MDLSSSIICILLHSLVFVSLIYSNNSLKIKKPFVNQTFRSEDELYKLNESIAIRLKQLNKPAVKTILSPDGDIIDCVLTHQQPAFDHPLLKGQKPLGPPDIPKGNNQMDNFNESAQLWSLSGESCPDGTIPIRRITEQDLLRASSDSRFGRKFSIMGSNSHQHAIQYVQDGEFYGAQASLNVWNPHGETPDLFSLAQMWVMAGTFEKDLNTIEVGWQIDQRFYGDRRTRFFIFWTADAYRNSCYNLQCPGFVQTNKDIAFGAAISPISTYNGKQFKISLSVWKDVKTGNWWLRYGYKNVGYWPSSLFTNLKDVASKVHWGGEILNEQYPKASSIQMGSGHFPEEGWQKAAYFNNINVLNSKRDYWVQPTNLQNYADSPNCYNVKGGVSRNWGTFFYYGGPGRNKNCL